MFYHHLFSFAMDVIIRAMGKKKIIFMEKEKKRKTSHQINLIDFSKIIFLHLTLKIPKPRINQPKNQLQTHRNKH